MSQLGEVLAHVLRPFVSHSSVGDINLVKVFAIFGQIIHTCNSKYLTTGKLQVGVLEVIWIKQTVYDSSGMLTYLHR